MNPTYHNSKAWPHDPADMRCAMLGGLVIILTCLLLISGCGDQPPVDPDGTDQTATEAPAPLDDHHSPAPDDEDSTEDEPITKPAETSPETESDPAPSADQDPVEDRDIAEIRQRIDTLVSTGQFTEARMLAQEQAAVTDGDAQEYLDARLISLRRLEQQGNQARTAIELLEGNAIEQRRGRRELLDGGQAGRILLTQAVREANRSLADEAITLLVVLDAVSAFPALLERYMTGIDDPQEQDLRDRLHEAMVAMAPRLDQQQLAGLPDLIRQDRDQRFPALVEILSAAMADPEHDQQWTDATAQLLKTYVEQAYEAGDDQLRAWALSVSDMVGLSLFQARINFQTEDAPTPDGYVADYGLVTHTVDDMRFGWERDNSDQARHRSRPDDIRYATMTHFRNGAWSIDVPNGRFQITLVTGDPSHTDQVCHLLINDLRLEDTSGGNNFMTHEFTLTVTNGQIVIKPGDDARNAKIVYLIIDPA